MKNHTLFLALFLLFSLKSFAQTTEQERYQPFSPSLRPTYSEALPTFVKMTFEANPNVFAIDAAFAAFKKEEKENGTFEPASERGEEAENQYEVFYERWRRAYEPFIQDDGAILLPTEEEFQRELSTQNATASTNTFRNAAANWTCVGPKETYWLKDNNAAQPPCPWQVNIYAFDISKSDPNILYSAAETGAVFKTIDKGLNWTACGSNFSFGGAAEAVEIHPTNPNIVFLGVGSNIYKTIDGGNTWTTAYTFSGLAPHDIAISPSNPNNMFIAGDKGLFQSIDGGANWTRPYTTACYDIEINPTNNNDVFLLKSNGTNCEFFKSTDGGATFNIRNIGTTAAREGRLAVSAADGNRIYALFTSNLPSPSNTPVLIKSTDEGENWTALNHAFCTGGVSDATGGQGYYDLSIAASQTNADQFVFGFCTTAKSMDGGATFSSIGGYCGNFPIHPDLQEAKTAANGDAWISTDGGLTLSTDFWTSTSNASARNNGIFAVHFWGFGQGWNEDIMVGGRYHNGNTAMADFYPAGKALRMGGAEQGTGYVLPGRTRAAAFSDLGEGWILPSTFYSNSEGRFPYSKYPNEDGYGYNASPLISDPRYSNHNYLGEGSTFWKTTDGGLSFNALYTFGSPVRRYDISRSNPNVLYLSTDASFYKSTDGGVNWTTVALPAGKSAGQLRLCIKPTDSQEIWIAFQNVSGTSLGKVYRSTNGGSSWVDMTTATLNSLKIKWVVHTETGVYISATSSKGRVLYRGNNDSDWTDFSTNLPVAIDILKIAPFFRDGKIRAAGDRGIWESPLFDQNFAPIAQPMVDKATSLCANDTFYFDDYSILNHSGSTWSWTFTPTPTYVSNANSRNPKVVFGAIGNYSASLTVSSAGGSNTKLLNNLISITADECAVSGVAGKAMSATSNGDYLLTPSINLGNTNTVTMMAWVRPTGIQASYAGILSCDGVTVNLNFRDNNELGLHWNDTQYGWSTGLIVPADKWSHVALVTTATDMRLYLNGVQKINTADPVVVNLTNRQWYGGVDRGNTSRNFKGAIDEVVFYNRSLTQNEIREQMHLTKIPTNDAAMKGYFQFNESGGPAFNQVNYNSAGLVGGATRVTSTAPVGTGTSERQTVTTGGGKNFSTTGVSLTFPSSGTLPNGELCVTRLTNTPDQLPNASPAAANYWIVNNYGSNATFAALSNMALTGYGAIAAPLAATPNVFKLYKRETGQDLATWGSSVAAATSVTAGTNAEVTFAAPNVTSFSQFTIVNENSALPLLLLDFKAILETKNTVQLTWETSQEQNTAFFEIEKSIDGRIFEKIGTLQAKGKSSLQQTYMFQDAAFLSNRAYYRLKIIDHDGDFRYSVLQTVRSEKAVYVSVYPNPIGIGKNVTFRTNLDEPFDVTITDITGKVILKNTFLTPEEATFNTNGLATGLYLFELKSKSYWQFGKIVVE